MKISIFFLCAILFSPLYSQECIEYEKMFNYVTDSLDEISYKVTHKLDISDLEESNFIGQMQSLENILYLMQKGYFDKKVEM